MKTTIFDDLEAMANGTLDVVNAEPFVLTPQKARGSTPNGRGGRDPDRLIVRGECVFEFTSAEAGLQLGVRKSYRESNDLRALQVGRIPVASIDRRIWFPNDENLPKQGDIIEFPDRISVPAFEIVSSQPDGHGRIVLKLVARGPQNDTFGILDPSEFG